MTEQEIKAFRKQASYLDPEQLERAVTNRIAANAEHIRKYGITLAEGEAMEKYMNDQANQGLTSESTGSKIYIY